MWSVLAAGALAATRFEFPKRVAWEYTFVLKTAEGSTVEGTGAGLIDWSSSDLEPSYVTTQRYATTAPSFQVVEDRTAGSAGFYTYEYRTADGTTGCTPASFTTFSRKVFTEETWVGSSSFKGKPCDMFIAKEAAKGAHGSLELVACAGTPVLLKWTARGSPGAVAEQTAYVTKFSAAPPAGADAQGTAFRQCTAEKQAELQLAAGLRRTIGATAKAGGAKSAAASAAELRRAAALEALEKQREEIAAWRAAQDAAAEAALEQLKARNALTEGRVKAAEEAKEAAERQAEKRMVDAEAAYEDKVAAIQKAEAGAGLGAAGNATAGELPPALRSASAALQAEVERIEKWKQEAKAAADAQHETAKEAHVETAQKLRRAEEAKEAIELEADRRMRAAEDAFAQAAAEAAEPQPRLMTAGSPSSKVAVAPAVRPEAAEGHAPLFVISTLFLAAGFFVFYAKARKNAGYRQL